MTATDGHYEVVPSPFVGADRRRKLDPAFKAQWTAALRSGEYRQCNSYLSTGGGYCCLGVAAEVLRKTYPDKIIRTEEATEPPSHYGVLFNGDGAIPGNEIAKLAYGDPTYENDFAPRVAYDSSLEPLYRLNDAWHLSFDEIADLIEEQL